MKKSIRDNIITYVLRRDETSTKDVAGRFNISRAYAHKMLKELINKGKVVLIGKTNNARYVIAEKGKIDKAKSAIKKYSKTFSNDGSLSEDSILEYIRQDTGILLGLKNNVQCIVGHSFMEIMNNAIEHSRSKEIDVYIEKDDDHKDISFIINDKGIGIFNNIIKKFKLKNELEAIQELTKGKRTTDPKKHTGEGIFFVSRMAKTLSIVSGTKKLTFIKQGTDILVNDEKEGKEGTMVIFAIDQKAKTNIKNVFRKYTTSYEFDKTEVIVKLYEIKIDYLSRSQARRILSGLDKFKRIVLDFRDVEGVGQAFADEIFRVWQNNHREIEITYRNANENIKFMINRAVGS